MKKFNAVMLGLIMVFMAVGVAYSDCASLPFYDDFGDPLLTGWEHKNLRDVNVIWEEVEGDGQVTHESYAPTPGASISHPVCLTESIPVSMHATARLEDLRTDNESRVVLKVGEWDDRLGIKNSYGLSYGFYGGDPETVRLRFAKREIEDTRSVTILTEVFVPFDTDWHIFGATRNETGLWSIEFDGEVIGQVYDTEYSSFGSVHLIFSSRSGNITDVRVSADNDTDGDGIPDGDDACPTAGADGPCGGPVKTNGCPVNDVDGDEICNDADICTWTGDAIYGITYSSNDFGCPLGDADGDTVPDDWDICAWSGDKGLGIYNNGCSVTDSDGDGIPNQPASYDNQKWRKPNGSYIKQYGVVVTSWTGLDDPDGDGMPTLDPNGLDVDLCPDQGSVGYGIDSFGCPIVDTDGDGMPDNFDACPTEGPTDDWGMTPDGCPIFDSDGDTIPDTQDLCPNQAGSRMNVGC